MPLMNERPFARSAQLKSRLKLQVEVWPMQLSKNLKQEKLQLVQSGHTTEHNFLGHPALDEQKFEGRQIKKKEKTS